MVSKLRLTQKQHNNDFYKDSFLCAATGNSVAKQEKRHLRDSSNISSENSQIIHAPHIRCHREEIRTPVHTLIEGCPVPF